MGGWASRGRVASWWPDLGDENGDRVSVWLVVVTVWEVGVDDRNNGGSQNGLLVVAPAGNGIGRSQRRWGVGR
ncbi:leucine-rich repeat extensin-like protein 7 [Iris pallida]|uniref:Leucine-rich repeat extensin-like protein 7 n=1 Tax=Iris pallida TaxID=29817 RepID=A0AAX6ER22_IRIPA|nr:leucine-rich repeat extensin-like protein 7 [Iris pallida]KAJ6815305.1 leucine-rich repeat extensin-like protein 7 [Iris pallida]